MLNRVQPSIGPQRSLDRVVQAQMTKTNGYGDRLIRSGWRGSGQELEASVNQTGRDRAVVKVVHRTCRVEMAERFIRPAPDLFDPAEVRAEVHPMLAGHGVEFGSIQRLGT